MQLANACAGHLITLHNNAALHHGPAGVARSVQNAGIVYRYIVFLKLSLDPDEAYALYQVRYTQVSCADAASSNKAMQTNQATGGGNMPEAIQIPDSSSTNKLS